MAGDRLPRLHRLQGRLKGDSVASHVRFRHREWTAVLDRVGKGGKLGGEHVDRRIVDGLRPWRRIFAAASCLRPALGRSFCAEHMNPPINGVARTVASVGR